MRYIKNIPNLPSLIKITVMVLIAIIVCDFGDPNGKDTNGNQLIFVDNLNAVKKHVDDNTKLNQAKVDGDLLKSSILYSGGCQPHKFKILGLKDFAESNPPQAAIYISHDANKDGYETYLTEEVAFDIAPLRERYTSIYQDDGPIQLAIYESGVYDKLVLLYEF